MPITRRHAIIRGLGAAVAVAVPVAGTTAALHATDPVVRLTSLDGLLAALDRIEAFVWAAPEVAGEMRAVRGGWGLERTFAHCAQSLEMAVTGFPEMKPAVFTATVGKGALAFFDARGAMAHGLDAPIPGAPDLTDGNDVQAGIDRLRAATLAFRDHQGPLAPHFAYGPVEPAIYGRVQAMHVANHLDAFPDLLPLIIPA